MDRTTIAHAKRFFAQRDTSNQTTLKAIEALGRKATIYTADLASPSDVAGIVPTVLADGHQVRILVNCAGIQRRHPSEQFPDVDFSEVLQVNLNTPFSLCRDVAAHMLGLPVSSGGDAVGRHNLNSMVLRSPRILINKMHQGSALAQRRPLPIAY